MQKFHDARDSPTTKAPLFTSANTIYLELLLCPPVYDGADVVTGTPKATITIMTPNHSP